MKRYHSSKCCIINCINKYKLINLKYNKLSMISVNQGIETSAPEVMIHVVRTQKFSKNEHFLSLNTKSLRRFTSCYWHMQRNTCSVFLGNFSSEKFPRIRWQTSMTYTVFSKFSGCRLAAFRNRDCLTSVVFLEI